MRDPTLPTDYRPELDGLRALAVLAVIGFHAGVPGFAGGYLGVDVFFVLSGYLIAAQLLRDHRAGTLSLRRFYERRARRIIPALYLVMGICIPFAWAWMLPDDLQNFGQSLVATSVFGNNLLLFLTSGYWRHASEFKPLLHTWSLGIEEQIYAVFPLLLAARLRMRTWTVIAATVAIAGLAWGEWRLQFDPVGAYMLVPARASEFLTGAILAGYPRNANVGWVMLEEALGVVGVLVVGACVLLFTTESPHPGVLTIVPVTATLLVIRFATPGTALGRLLGSRVPVAIGLASYSLYLWHQPMLAFLRIRSIEPPGMGEVAAALAASAVLAALSWRYVELPGRRTMTGRSIWMLTFGGALFFGGLGTFLHFQSGLVARNAELAGASGGGRHINAAYNGRAFRFRNASFADGARHRVLVVGNSQARDFINSAVENGYLGEGSLSYSDEFPECPDHGLPATPAGIVSRAQVIVFMNPPADPACWARSVAYFAAAGTARIVALGPKYFGWNMNAIMLLPEGERLRLRSRVPAQVREENDELARVIGPAHFVDQLRMLGDTDGRIPPLTAGGFLISQDGVHLTAAGARQVGRVVFEHPLLRDLRQ